MKIDCAESEFGLVEGNTNFLFCPRESKDPYLTYKAT